MKINITFDQLEEATELLTYLIEHKPKAKEKIIDSAKAWAPEKPAEKQLAAKKEMPQPEASAPKEETQVVDKVTVRGMLFKLNKKTGVNESRELIQALGYNRLDDVKPEDLPKLYEKAKEALDA